MIPDTVQPGERVTWRTLNGYASGLVVSNDDRGVLAQVDNGKYVVLSTERAIRFAKDDRARRREAYFKK